ncbi:hypothetical protein [Mesorhizobium sp. NFR06]|uniref:hypothetical protein n=1 Tax=Mesorhizobium sp. NFR06 TaxID=1566290 RepID=UPI00165F14E0|nr:hypothetical protein [Mesorhizobium sp. NFR06]
MAARHQRHPEIGALRLNADMEGQPRHLEAVADEGAKTAAGLVEHPGVARKIVGGAIGSLLAGVAWAWGGWNAV